MNAEKIKDTAEEKAAAIVLDASNFDVSRHNGWITIENPASGGHRSFQVDTVKGEPDPKNFFAGKRIVRLLTGPDRYSDTTAFGFVEVESVRNEETGEVVEFGTVKVWRRFKGDPGKPSEFEKFARMLEYPAQWAAKGCVYHCEARCRRCNRLLTHPESVTTGYGPWCGGRGSNPEAPKKPRKSRKAKATPEVTPEPTKAPEYPGLTVPAPELFSGLGMEPQATAVAIATCQHEYKGLSKKECDSRGITHHGRCYHVHECVKCGEILANDSSD